MESDPFCIYSCRREFHWWHCLGTTAQKKGKISGIHFFARSQNICLIELVFGRRMNIKCWPGPRRLIKSKVDCSWWSLVPALNIETAEEQSFSWLSWWHKMRRRRMSESMFARCYRCMQIVDWYILGKPRIVYFATEFNWWKIGPNEIEITNIYTVLSEIECIKL